MSKHIKLKQYSLLISKISQDLGPKFSTLCSPTLSKQETITFLFDLIYKTSLKRNLKRQVSWNSMALFIPRLSWMFLKVLFISQCLKIKHIPEQSVIFRTWLVPACFFGSALRDEYFRDLPAELAVNESVFTCYSGTDLKLIAKFVKSHKRENISHSLGLLSFTDVLQLFWEYLSTALFSVKKPYFLNGFDITPFVNDSCLNDYFRLNSFEAYAEKYKCRRLKKYNVKAFIYVFENQSWEKVVCREFKNTNIKTVAYQSSGFSKRFLNFYPNKIDCINDPSPNIILTVGHYFKKHLEEHSIFACPIEEFCALRFDYPVIGSRYIVQQPSRKVYRRVLYAFSVNLVDYAEIIEDLVDVFGGSEVFVDLKFHPLCAQAIKSLGKMLPVNFQIIEQVDLRKANKTYDCVIFNDNSFGIECMFLGIKSFEYYLESNLNDQRLFYFDEWSAVLSKREMVDLRDHLISSKFDKNFSEKNISKYLNSMYRPYTKECLVKFRKLLNLSSSR